MTNIVWEDARDDVRVSALSDYVGILLCPQCNGNNGRNLHITEASVHRGDDIITVACNRVSLKAKKNRARGVIITLEYEGECGHHGLIVFHFCKGNTFVHHRPLSGILDEKGMLHYSKKGDIFRD